MATEEVGIRLTLQQRRETAKGLTDTASEVRAIGSAAEDTGRRASRALGVLKGIGGAVATSARVGTQALGALAVAGGTWGLRVASANEQASISFTTMLGDAQAAGGFIKDLQAFAAKTPFEFAGLQQSASSLISAGINADKVIPIMTSLGNATSGMNTGAEGIQRATVALQQMNAAGKISAEDLNQLRDAGIPVYELLSKATGKSTAAIAKLVDKGKLGRKELGQLMDALETGKGLERFAGLMDKQSASIAGKWSTIKDNVGQGLGRVVEPWIPQVKKALDGATNASGPFFDKLTRKSAELAAKAPAAIDLVRAKFRAGKADVDGFLAGLRGEGAIDGASSRLNTLGLGVAALASSYRNGKVTSDGFVGTMQTIGATAGQTVEKLRTSFDDGGTGAQGLSDALGTATDTFQVAGVVVGWLAGHLDELAALMPWLAAGYALIKAGQLAANAAAVLAIPTAIAQVFANRALAASNRELAAAQLAATGSTVANTGAENVNTLTRGRNLLGMIAQRGAMLAGAAATGIVTAAQWAWNVALSANPIGLVVLGIAALVAGVVIAYKRFEWFRDAIGWVWDKLKALWDLAKKAGSFLGGLLTGGSDGGEVASIPGRAAGGDVKAGEPYIVGERRAELFVPKVDGTILPRIPKQRTGDVDGALASVAQAPSGDLTVPVVIDGREVGRATLSDFRTRQARQ